MNMVHKLRIRRTVNHASQHTIEAAIGSNLKSGVWWQVMSSSNATFVHADDLTANASPTASASDGKVMLWLPPSAELLLLLLLLVQVQVNNNSGMNGGCP